MHPHPAALMAGVVSCLLGNRDKGSSERAADGVIDCF